MEIYETDINFKTLEETAPEVNDAFPYRCACTNLQNYPGKEFPWHWHSDVEILYITEGAIEFKTPCHKYILEKGDIIFLSSETLHCTLAVDDLPGIHMEFIFSPLLIGGNAGSQITKKYVSPLVSQDLEPIIIKSDNPINEKLVSYLLIAFDAFHSKSFGFELEIRHTMEMVWMLLLQEGKGHEIIRRGTNDERIKSILSYINDNYTSAISLNNVASSIHISTRECSRIFKKELGLTIMDYLLSFRLNASCEMLQKTSKSISEIAMSCGFASSSYFTKVFKEAYGITPKEYRK